MQKNKKREYKKQLAIQKLISEFSCKIINECQTQGTDYICYENEDGTRGRITMYQVLNSDSFRPYNHLLRDTNPFCVYNANLQGANNNGTEVLEIHKQYATIRCGKCKKIYTQLVKSFTSPTSFKMCEECRAKEHTTKLKKQDEVFDHIRNLGFDILPNQTYQGTKVKIGIQNSEGYKGEMNYENLKKGCKMSPFAKYNSYALENIRLYVKKNGFECIIPNQKYQGWDLPLKIQCKCGKIFTTSTTHLIYDNQFQCVNCSNAKSNNEKVVEQWLKKHKIEFITQYRFDDCKYKNTLPFDFYIPSINTLIEVDGEGHERPVRFNGKSKELAEKHFKDTLKRDDIKNRYCKAHNINLIRINYRQINDNTYKDILSTLFSKE